MAWRSNGNGEACERGEWRGRLRSEACGRGGGAGISHMGTSCTYWAVKVNKPVCNHSHPAHSRRAQYWGQGAGVVRSFGTTGTTDVTPRYAPLRRATSAPPRIISHCLFRATDQLGIIDISRVFCFLPNHTVTLPSRTSLEPRIISILLLHIHTYLP